jgi:hypothetical protein
MGSSVSNRRGEAWHPKNGRLPHLNQVARGYDSCGTGNGVNVAIIDEQSALAVLVSVLEGILELDGMVHRVQNVACRLEAGKPLDQAVGLVLGLPGSQLGADMAFCRLGPGAIVVVIRRRLLRPCSITGVEQC